MQADSFSPEVNQAGDSWQPYVHAAAAALVVGVVGAFGTLQVWVLALVAGAVAFSLQRRDSAEPATTDRSATLLKLGFIAVLCGAAFDNQEQHIDPLRPSPLGAAAIALVVAGLYLRRRALAALGRHFSIKVVLRDDHRLVDDGPYRTIRHPNYAGLVLVMVGTAIMLQSPLAVAAVLLLWLPALLLRIRQEESALIDHLGEVYVRYAARTWRLVPFVY